MVFEFPTLAQLKPLIEMARAEDLGAALDDVTSRLTIPADRVGAGTLHLKGAAVVAGLPIVPMVASVYDERLRVEATTGSDPSSLEGRYFEHQRMPLLRVVGPMRSLLAAERVMLNFIQRISGVATRTREFVKRVEGTRAKVYDTRKTLPGHRLLDKYAVRCGGGCNHRIGLYDAVFVKDNHLAGVGMGDLAAFLSAMISAAYRERDVRQVVVEVDTLQQLSEVLKVAGVGVILLDNMTCREMEQAVRLRDASGSGAELEASGGVNLDTIGEIAATGVERISVGAVTHSAPASDISLDVETAL